MQKKLNFDYAMIQSTFWMLYSAAGIFVSVFLLDKGYTNTSIGMSIAIGSLLAILLQSLIANVADRVTKITDITVIKLLILALFIMVLAVLLIGEKSLALIIAYIGLIVVHTTMHPFVNALSFTLEETGYQVSYGLGRSMGSLFAGVLCFVMGYLVSWFGANVVLYVALMNLVLMSIVIFMTGRHYSKGLCSCTDTIEGQEFETSGSRERSEKVGADDPGAEEAVFVSGSEPISMVEFVKRNKIFMLMSSGIVALFFGNVVLENFTIQIVENIGGATEQMGFVIFLLSIFEMPAMLAFNRLKEKFSYVFLLRVAAVFFTLKIIMMYLADSMFVVYLAQLNQVLGYGLLFPALVSFIDHIMEKGEALRGQAVFTIALTVGNVLGSVFGGMILDAYDPHMLLLISSVISIAGTIMIVVFVGKIKSYHVGNAGKKVKES